MAKASGWSNNSIVSDALIRVAILSPYQLVVEGLGAILSRHPDVMEVVTMPGRVGEDEPDVVLYDVSALADTDSTDLERLMLHRSCAVIALARDPRPDLLRIAVAHSVDASLRMEASEQELVELVLLLALHLNEPDATDKTNTHTFGADVGFSEREGWVMTLIAQGFTNADIAAQGFVSINTVKSHIRTAYRKAGVRSRSQAVRWVLQHGDTAHDDALPVPHHTTSN